MIEENKNEMKELKRNNSSTTKRCSRIEK